MKKALKYAFVYVVISLLFELLMIFGFGFRVPQDNATLGPLIISIPPLILALLYGRESKKKFFILLFSTAILTLIITLTFIAITGISTGFVEPIFNRGLAGILAYRLTTRFTRKSS